MWGRHLEGCLFPSAGTVIGEASKLGSRRNNGKDQVRLVVVRYTLQDLHINESCHVNIPGIVKMRALQKNSGETAMIA